MPIEITLPRQGWSTDQAAFVEWLKKDGDPVQAGEPLFSVETEKAIQEIEALDSGILRLAPNGPVKGDRVQVGDVIGYLPSADEAVSFEPIPRPIRSNSRLDSPGTIGPACSSRSPSPGPSDAAEGDSSDAPPVTPRAARRALRNGVDLRIVTGSGAGGRIRERDIIAAQQTVPVSSTATAPRTHTDPDLNLERKVPVSGLRRSIAEHLLASQSVTAPVTLTRKVAADALVRLRQRFKAEAPPGTPVPTYGDLIMKLVATALEEHPLLNARWERGEIVRSHAVNIGLAVDTEDGLLVPVVHDVPGMTLIQLAAHTRDLVDRARRRHLTTEDLVGGTFTLSNLGALGVDAFTPIINHPECAILGLGRIGREPAAAGGQIVIRDHLWLSLTFDHRIVDGAPAARFLDTLAQALEEPSSRLGE